MELGIRLAFHYLYLCESFLPSFHSCRQLIQHVRNSTLLVFVVGSQDKGNGWNPDCNNTILAFSANIWSALPVHHNHFYSSSYLTPVSCILGDFPELEMPPTFDGLASNFHSNFTNSLIRPPEQTKFCNVPHPPYLEAAKVEAEYSPGSFSWYVHYPSKYGEDNILRKRAKQIICECLILQKRDSVAERAFKIEL